MFRKLRGGTVVAVLMLAAGVLAASAASATREAGAASPYNVMLITGSNTAINNNPNAIDGLQVAADNINRTGGIGGRPLAVTFCNVQSSAAVGAQCARQAVDGNFDDVIQVNAFSTASTPILDAAQMPQISSQPNTPVDFVSKYQFALLPPVQATVAAIALYMGKTLKFKRLAFFGVDVATNSLNYSIWKTALRAVHVANAGVVVPPLSTTDFSSYAAKLKELNADGSECGVAGPQTLPLMAALRQLGVTTRCGNSITTLSSDVQAQLPDGYVIGSPLPVPGTTSLPGDKLYVSQMKAAGKSDAVIGANNAFFSWLAAYSLQALAKHVKGPVTKASMLAAAKLVNSPKTAIKLFGIVSWMPGKKGPAALPNASASTIFMYEIKSGTPVFKTKIDVWPAIGYTKK